MLNLIFFVIGLLAAVIINTLADYLPSSHTPLRPQWHTWGWSQRKRPLLVFVGTAVIFAILPLFLTDWVDAAVNSFHIAVLILIIVTDLEHKLIFNKVVWPATAIALLTSLIVSPEENNLRLALVGAVVGFAIFYVLYWLAQMLYGAERVPLGYGDVKLAMLMGAMLGFHRIIFALILGIFLGGVISLLLLISRRVDRTTALPYGQYLAIAGIIMLIWGAQYVRQFLN
ncbi:prepilin peptidase [Candidatus Leptofilum sp.]|uniref:prepilin peptidase n=1 Tax=Candidatus Leptofilum sp. TaxID=3241576 RepID=UPI003B59A1A7